MYVDTQRKYTKLYYIYLFIYYVDTVDTTFTEYTRFNGTYANTVDMIKLQCKSLSKVFELQRTSNKVFELQQNLI